MEKPLQCKPCVPGAAAGSWPRPSGCRSAAAPSPLQQHPDMSGHRAGGWQRGLCPGANAVPLSPGAQDVRGQADAAAAPGFPGLCAGLGRRVRHDGDPLRRGAGGHAAVRLRGQGLLLQ